MTSVKTQVADFALELAGGQVLRMPGISAEQLVNLIVALEVRREG
jgi:hypothetical protein